MIDNLETELNLSVTSRRKLFVTPRIYINFSLKKSWFKSLFMYFFFYILEATHFINIISTGIQASVSSIGARIPSASSPKVLCGILVTGSTLNFAVSKFLFSSHPLTICSNSEWAFLKRYSQNLLYSLLGSKTERTAASVDLSWTWGEIGRNEIRVVHRSHYLEIWVYTRR